MRVPTSGYVLRHVAVAVFMIAWLFVTSMPHVPGDELTAGPEVQLSLSQQTSHPHGGDASDLSHKNSSHDHQAELAADAPIDFTSHATSHSGLQDTDRPLNIPTSLKRPPRLA